MNVKIELTDEEARLVEYALQQYVCTHSDRISVRRGQEVCIKIHVATESKETER